MAILHKWKVTVETEGKPVQELKATTEGHPQPGDNATKYIEVKSCTNFAVRIIAPKAFKLHGNAVVADISLDGVCYDRRLFDKYTKKGGRTALSARDKVVVGQELPPSDGSGRLRPFEFAVLRGHGSAAATVDEEALNKVGSIEVKLFHFQKVRWSAVKHGTDRDTDNAEPHVAYSHAQVLGRNVSHVMKLGNERSHKRTKPWAGDIIGTAFATFVFKYRSHDALQKIGIIHRDPTPEPPGETPVDEWNIHQLRHFVKQVQDVATLQTQPSAPFPTQLGQDVKDESTEIKIFKDEYADEIKDEAGDTCGLKREVPDGSIFIDLTEEAPPPKKRKEGTQYTIPTGAEIIVIDEDQEEALFVE